MVLFFVVNFYNGFIAYNLDKNKTIESKTEIAWFVSELCLSLGMIGTVIGFIQMLAGFSSLNIGNVSSMQSLVVNMGYGMATALYTTLAGLIFGNILKIEAFDIERSFKNMVEQNGNK
jgi:biopolymer transport protein ExbB/TolQ